MPSYDFPTQRNIVIACMCLHNYLRRVALNDELFRLADDENAVLNSVEEHEGNNIEVEGDDGDNSDIFRPSEMLAMKTTRDQIANQLGRNYLG
ncbi:hypothetical protein ACHQM5_004512 [Ranunculus cassubicifolius]